MKNFKNIFINNNKTSEQFCFILDGNRYYRFNGKYGLYDQGLINEKREYALRVSNSAEAKQVYGIFSGLCPHCGKQHENTPVVKFGQNLTVICEGCNDRFIAKESTSILTVLDYHVNRNECVNYEAIDIDEEEMKIDDFVEELADDEE